MMTWQALIKAIAEILAMTQLQTSKSEDSFLARIFHTSHSEATEKADGTRRRQNFDQGCMSTYRSGQNSTTTQYPSALAEPQTERYEISGLALGIDLRSSNQ